MKNMIKPSMRFWFMLSLLIGFGACQKDDETVVDVRSGLEAFSIESEIQTAEIDQVNKTIMVHIGDLMNWENLKVTYSTNNGARLFHAKNELVSGVSTLDLTQPVELFFQSENGAIQDAWQLKVNSLVSDYGLGNVLHKAASIDKGHSYYFDQFGTGAHQYINCGPAVTTMALKWADVSFTKKPQDARHLIRPQGGWWLTSDIANYLYYYGVSYGFSELNETLSIAEYGSIMMEIIDKGYAAILCLDMFYVHHEKDGDVRTNKFYETKSDEWGHFILVKGYKVVDETVWLEIYDPYSINERYNVDNQLKGKNRYYAVSELKKATDIWWPHAIVVAPKGSQVVNVGVMPKSMINTLKHQRGR